MLCYASYVMLWVGRVSAPVLLFITTVASAVVTAVGVVMCLHVYVPRYIICVICVVYAVNRKLSSSTC